MIDKEKKLNDALLKKALGFNALEVIEEYGEDGDGNVRLVKKKVTKKFVPPDLAALKMIGESQKTPSEMTDEELLAEKDRLLDELLKNKKINILAAETERLQGEISNDGDLRGKNNLYGVDGAQCEDGSQGEDNLQCEDDLQGEDGS